MVALNATWFQQLPPSAQQILLEGPALAPPAGVLPNFDHPPNRNALGYGVLIASAIVSLLLVLGRLYAGIVYNKRLSIEDYISVVALGVLAGYLYFTFGIILSPGLYVHQWDVRFKDIPHFLYHVSSASAIYGNVIMLLKVGILLHWTHIFVPPGVRNGFWWTCHIVLWINIVFYVICIFIEIFGCTPREKNWNPTMEGKCLNIPKKIIISSFINFVSDIIIFVLPQKIIWGLRMSTKQKVGIGAIFAAGILVTISAGIRIKYTFEFADNDDATYAVSPLGLWSHAEMTAGFMVLCLPSLPKIFRESSWMKKMITSLSLFTRSKSGQTKSFHGVSWPRAKSKRAPHASLFTDTDEIGFVPLTNLSGASGNWNHEKRTSTSIINEHIDVVPAENGR